MDAVIYQPIGVINTPFIDEAPRQPIFSNETGTVTIFDEYVQGLKNIEQHSHVVLIFSSSSVKRIYTPHSDAMEQ